MVSVLANSSSGRSISTKSFNQDRGTFILASCLELFQEPGVVRPEIADIFNVVAQHGYPSGADPGGETGIFRRVVAAVAQHGGVHHAAAHNFQPAGAFADHAALAAAQKTFH